MALSEEEKTRIREEELYRLQIREEFRIMSRHAGRGEHVNGIVFLILFAIAFAGMWMLVSSVKERRSLAPAAHVFAIPGTGSAVQG